MRFLTAFICFCGLSSIISAGQFSFSESLEDHAIVTRPSLLIINEESEIEVALQCGAQASGIIRLTLYVDDKLAGEKQLPVAPDTVLTAVFPYTASETGWKTVKAIAQQGDSQNQVSRQIPAVSYRLYFPWFGFADQKATTFVLERCQFANMVLSRNEGAYWRRRGVMPMRWRSGNWKPKKEGDTYGEYLANGLEEGLCDGVMIDEIGGYDNFDIREKTSVQGLKEFCQKDRNFFLALWVPGVPKESLVNLGQNKYRKKGIDLLMFEVYNNYLATELGSYDPVKNLMQRLEIARSQDVLYHSVITIGIKGQEKVYRLSDEEVEDQVRAIRKMAPEMPGLGVFALSQEGRAAELSTFADYLCGKYFVNAVLTVYDSQVRISDPSPVKGTKVKLSTKVYNIGAMDSGPVKVTFFDGDPAGKGRKIGEKMLDSVASRRENGFPSHAEVEVEWQAQKAGACDIFVQLNAENKQNVVLEPFAKRKIMVR